jgi:hypothetical protein
MQTKPKTEEKQINHKTQIKQLEKKSTNVFRGSHRGILIMLGSSFPSR